MRMSDDEEARRERIENGLAALAGAGRRLELVALRIRQAKARSGLIDLLQPAEMDLIWIIGKLALAAGALRETWQQGETDHWKDNNHV